MKPKRSLRRTLAALMAAAVLTAPVFAAGKTDDTPVDAPQAEMTLTDVTTGDWFYESVMAVLDAGVMKPVTKTEFAPALDASRGEIITALWRIAGSPGATSEANFTDLPEDEDACAAIRWATEHKILRGYAGKTVRPDAAVTREELAVLLYGFAKFCGVGIQGDNAAAFGSKNQRTAWPLSYADSDDISDWAYEAVCWCDLAGILRGDSTGFHPAGTTTRAQLATVVNRLSDSVWAPQA